MRCKRCRKVIRELNSIPCDKAVYFGLDASTPCESSYERPLGLLTPTPDITYNPDTSRIFERRSKRKKY